MSSPARRPVVRSLGPAAERCCCASGRGCRQHGVDACADGGRTGRTVGRCACSPRGPPSRHARPRRLDRVGSFAPSHSLVRCHWFRGCGDEADRPVALRPRLCQFHRHKTAHAQADGRRAHDPKVVKQPLDVSGVLTHHHRVRCGRALAEARKSGANTRKPSRKAASCGSHRVRVNGWPWIRTAQSPLPTSS